MNISITPQSEDRAESMYSLPIPSVQEQSNVNDGLCFRAGMEHIASINQSNKHFGQALVLVFFNS